MIGPPPFKNLKQGAAYFEQPCKYQSAGDNSALGISAPRKEFVAIPGGGHFAVWRHADLFLKEMTTRVRPLALQAQTARKALR